MKQNMGNADRTVRITAAILIGILIFANVVTGTLAVVLGLFAVIFLVTSLFKFCPLYVPFRISTSRTERQPEAK
jgi:hypothetical protein